MIKIFKMIIIDNSRFNSLQRKIKMKLKREIEINK